jgi:hypothetical protein
MDDVEKTVPITFEELRLLRIPEDVLNPWAEKHPSPEEIESVYSHT